MPRREAQSSKHKMKGADTFVILDSYRETTKSKSFVKCYLTLCAEGPVDRDVCRS